MPSSTPVVDQNDPNNDKVKRQRSLHQFTQLIGIEIGETVHFQSGVQANTTVIASWNRNGHVEWKAAKKFIAHENVRLLPGVDLAWIAAEAERRWKLVDSVEDACESGFISETEYNFIKKDVSLIKIALRILDGSEDLMPSQEALRLFKTYKTKVNAFFITKELVARGAAYIMQHKSQFVAVLDWDKDGAIDQVLYRFCDSHTTKAGRVKPIKNTSLDFAQKYKVVPRVRSFPALKPGKDGVPRLRQSMIKMADLPALMRLSVIALANITTATDSSNVSDYFAENETPRTFEPDPVAAQLMRDSATWKDWENGEIMYPMNWATEINRLFPGRQPQLLFEQVVQFPFHKDRKVACQYLAQIYEVIGKAKVAQNAIARSILEHLVNTVNDKSKSTPEVDKTMKGWLDEVNSMMRDGKFTGHYSDYYNTRV